jgi:hypothetical protein
MTKKKPSKKAIAQADTHLTMEVAGETATIDPDMVRMARRTRTLIGVLATVLCSLFAWLQLRDIPFTPIVENLSARAVFKATMFVYYTCWIAGTKWDTDDQELLYSVAPGDGTLPSRGILTAVLLAALFGLLCWVPSPRVFAILLGLFLALNVVSWRFLVTRITRKATGDARQLNASRKNYGEVACLQIWNRYMDGRWQWYRFLAGALLIIAINAMAFSGLHDVFLAGLRMTLEMLMTIGIMLFIGVMESWIWVMRIKTRYGIEAIREVSNEYSLSPRKVKSVPSASC